MIPAWNISPIKKSGDVKKVRLEKFHADLDPDSRSNWIGHADTFAEPDFPLQPPQFVDILLAEEDSSDEEYRPDDEDEDETAEDVRLL